MKNLKTVFACFEEKAKSLQVGRAALTAGTAFALSPVALAADDSFSGGMPAIMTAFDTVVTLLTKVWTLMTSNPLLTLFLAAGLVGIGVRVFRQIKRAAKG